MKKLMPVSLLLLTCILFYSFAAKKKTLIYGIDKIEKNWGMVKANFFANKFEVTNLEYQTFLNSVKSKVAPEIFESIKIHNENWNYKENIKLEPWVKNYHQHPAYFEYPVVNISQTGATAYCEWLTEVYNAKPKRKYNKVKFRLPTEKEWLEAASAGNQAPFPWGGYYLRNGKGCLLANFRHISDSVLKRDAKTGQIEMASKSDNKQLVADINDATTSPAPAISYFPNNFGLYNMSGNVAEMLAESNRTKGGSWASSGYYIRIDAEDEYAGFSEPTPMIGFRYFVEIIEE